MATIGALATFRDRIGIVDDTVKSLFPQIDLLLIYCNDLESYENARRITPSGNVKTFMGPNITDRGKFHFCGELSGLDHTYFTFDDDLIYPPDYIRHTMMKLEQYNGRVIVSYHGKELRGKVDSYYARLTPKQQRSDYRVLSTVDVDHEVNVIGTGCTAFNLGYFCPAGLKEDMMADVEVSCQARGLKKIVLAHKAGWIRYHPKMAGKWTIWDYFQKNSDQRQVELLKKIW